MKAKSMRSAVILAAFAWAAAFGLHAQEGQAPTPVADPAELAFEEGRWEDAIGEYREILAAYPEDRLSLLRIAQAQRELKRHDDALATLETARTANAPEAMIDLERARNEAQALLEQDPDLALPQHRKLAARVDAFWANVVTEVS